MNLPAAGVSQPGCTRDYRPAQGIGERPQFSPYPVAEILGDLQSQPAILQREISLVFLALSRRARSACGSITTKLPRSAKSSSCFGTRLCGSRMAAHLSTESVAPESSGNCRTPFAQNAPHQEIDRLMSELRQALDRYLQALAENMARTPNQNRQPLDPSQQPLTGRDLERMIERARELAKNGQRDQARQLLSELQNMLENLRMATPGEERNKALTRRSK